MHAPVAAIQPAEKFRTITLTNRAPIRIKEEDWPVIAQGSCGEDQSDYGGGQWSIEVRVRKGKHRTIIHANYSYYDGDADGQDVRVGRLLPFISEYDFNETLWKHILAVGEELRIRIANDYHQNHVKYALDDCFAKLPPVELK